MHLSDDRLFGLHERDPDIEREKNLSKMETVFTGYRMGWIART